MNAELYRLIVESSADVVTLQDGQGRLVYVSPSARQLTGFDPQQLVGTAGDDLIHPDDRGRAAADDVEFRCRRADGSYRWVRALARPLPPADGRPPGRLVCLRDISARKAGEDRRLKEQKAELVGRLAGGIAHEFNNLLTVITGYVCLLLENHRPGDADYDSLGHVQRAADRGAAMIRRLLAVGGRLMLTPRETDLGDFLGRRADGLRRLLGPDITLRLERADDLPTVWVDPVALEQMVLELVGNAREAMPGGGTLTLGTARAEAEDGGPAVCLRVADDGCGMDEATRARLFEPFFTTRAAGQRAGLGLAAVAGTMRQCGGHVAVASRPGAGTTFTLTFPAVVPSEPEA